MRHSAVSSLLTEENVIVVSSVSCIYGIGDPDDYENNLDLREFNIKEFIEFLYKNHKKLLNVNCEKDNVEVL